MTSFLYLLSKVEMEITSMEPWKQSDLHESSLLRLLYRRTEYKVLYQQSHRSRISQSLTPVACKLYVTGSHSKSNNVLKNSVEYKVREEKSLY